MNPNVICRQWHLFVLAALFVWVASVSFGVTYTIAYPTPTNIDDLRVDTAANTAATASNTASVATISAGMAAGATSLSTMSAALLSHTTSLATVSAGIAADNLILGSHGNSITSHTASLATVSAALAADATSLATVSAALLSHTTSLATISAGMATNDTLVASQGSTLASAGSGLFHVTASGTLRWQDLRVPLNTTKINPAGNPPTFDNYKSLNVGDYQFSGTVLNECFFTAQMPHGIARSQHLEAHAHYAADSDIALNSTATLGLEYFFVGTNGVIPSSTTTLTKNFSGVSSGTHLLCDLGEIALPASGIDSSLLVCRFFRPGNTDVSNVLLHVFEVDFHYHVQAVGSIGEYGD